MPTVSGERIALIVVSDTYEDSHFADLRAPQQDLDALTDVLGDPAIGGFSVSSLLNEPAHVITEEVEGFLSDRRPGDLALLFFACHGVKDDFGQLFLAASTTKLKRLNATGVSAEFIEKRMAASRADQIVLLLDCCFSGAFSGGAVPRAGQQLDVADRLGGKGRLVITASNATEYAFEDGERVRDDPAPSFFTSAVVEGLRTGAADRDGDGRVSAEELYFFVYDHVRERTAKQTPTRSLKTEGDIYIARTVRRLPAELDAALESQSRWERRGAVAELRRHAAHLRMGLGPAAQQALRRLGVDDEPEIGTAVQALTAPEPSGESGWLEPDPLWYRRAVFYEVDVRAFFDADGDGCGDLRGIRDKLDYLQWLGIDCIWALPFHASASPFEVDRRYGIPDDLQELVEGAHERRIRLMTDISPDEANAVDVMRFWLDIGMDGVALAGMASVDRLQELRAVADAHFPDRVLAVTGTAWDDSLLAWFGGGDAANLVLVSPLAAALFLAIRREEREPLLRRLRMVDPPGAGQWGVFLRNRDPLDIRSLPGDEQEYMLAEYAKDPAMRTPKGIGRRLAPLTDNNIHDIRLLHAILFALPGSPVLYYGDEIAMGDNVYLGDRDGVRTPMQWTGDRNGGFSQADLVSLYAPPLMDPVYGFPAVNVEAELRQPASLLRWIKRLIALRRAYPILGAGGLEPLYPSNPRVLALVRSYEGEHPVLFVANLSRGLQLADLDLSPWELRTPVEMFGRTEFPPIGGHAYRLTLGARGFYFFELREPTVDVG